MLFDAALSAKQIRTILTQECLYRLCITFLFQSLQIFRTNTWMNLCSGYSENSRPQMLDSGQKAYEKMIYDGKEGVKKL